MSEATATPPKDPRAMLQKHGAQALRAAAVDAEPWEPEVEPEPQAAPARFFYDGVKYYLDTGREFVPMDCRSVTRHLRAGGCNPAAVDAAICEIQTVAFVHHAGPLAGLDRGLHIMNGHRLLATTSPKIPQAVAGEWQTLRAVIHGLLDDPEGPQVHTFLAWLKFARESLVARRYRPGQALALAGPRNCGKSLLIDVLEVALGGRRGNPYPCFTGRTNFNADIAGAELLAVDDEAGSTDIRARKALASSIKSNLFAGAVRVEAKHRGAFTFRPCWRMVIALNDEPEALLVLPPLTEDVGDKLSLLRCHKRPLPMPAHTLEEKERFFARLLAELPALLAWLESWTVPPELREERCGVRHWHHPELVATLLELAPEGQLSALIDTAESTGGIALPWEGTAAELKALLSACQATSRDAEKLLGHWQPATGTYLGRLEGERAVKLTKIRGAQRWRVS
ncbi:MAG: primase-helicase family protein [Akkermansiaceae bacterium]